MNRRAFVVLAFLGAAACGSDASTAPTSVAGTWALQTVNGSSLPFVVSQSGADKAEILGDTIKILAAGSFTAATIVRTTFGGVVATQTVADTGTYKVSGSTLTLTSTSEGSNGTGTWSGNTLTATIEGLSFVFKR